MTATTTNLEDHVLRHYVMLFLSIRKSGLDAHLGAESIRFRDMLGSLLQLKHGKFDHDFVMLLLNNFNPDVRQLKVGRKHILVIETDVKEIFDLRSTGHDVPMTGEPRQLEALVAICDRRSGP